MGHFAAVFEKKAADQKAAVPPMKSTFNTSKSFTNTTEFWTRCNTFLLKVTGSSIPKHQSLDSFEWPAYNYEDQF